MQVLNKKITDDLWIFFLLIAFINVSGSKIFLEGTVYKAIESLTIFVSAAFHDESCLFLYQSNEALCLRSLFSASNNQLSLSEKIFNVIHEKARGNINRCTLSIVVVIRCFLLRTFVQHKTEVGNIGILVFFDQLHVGPAFMCSFKLSPSFK